MTGSRPADILRRLEPAGAADADLARQFASHRDQAAFAEIVRRHGPVVWSVCRRGTTNCQDAEDAFQATFLVLVRRLAAIRNPDLLGNFLYGVAVRVAMRARRSASRRRRREVQVPTMPDPPTPPVEPASDLGPVLDEELAGLPAYYREAVVLCDLRGVSRPEAAKLLGIPEGTLSSRLAAGRKKLAARLAKRGVTLAVAAVPPVLANMARAAVPPELAVRVVHQSTGAAAIPVAVARLASEGFSVKTTLLMTVVLGSAIAGVVYAAQPGDAPPQPDPPKPPAVAKADPKAEPQPKPDPQAKGDGVGFTTNPKLTRAFDLGMRSTGAFRWNPDGTVLAVAGTEPVRGADGKRDPKEVEPIIKVIPLGDSGGSWLTRLGAKHQLVAFTASGKGLVTAVREYDLISGRHQLHFWEPEPERKGFLTTQKLMRTTELDSSDTHGYHFAPDGKMFRTITYDRDGGAAKKIDIQEVDVATGKTLRSLLKVDDAHHLLSPDGKRLATVEKDGKVTVYDVDRGAKLSEYTLPEREPVPVPKGGRDGFGGFPGGREPGGREEGPGIYWTFSPDGKRLVVSRRRQQLLGRFYGSGETIVLNTDTGEPLPALEGAELMTANPGPGSFSGDGRLLAMTGGRYTPAGKAGLGGQGPKLYEQGGSFLTVWDTQTGKVVKSWDRRGKTEVAFNPVRPLLAILEPNGEETRLGLWDFAADAGKK